MEDGLPVWHETCSADYWQKIVGLLIPRTMKEANFCIPGLLTGAVHCHYPHSADPESNIQTSAGTKLMRCLHVLCNNLTADQTQLVESKRSHLVSNPSAVNTWARS